MTDAYVSATGNLRAFKVRVRNVVVYEYVYHTTTAEEAERLALDVRGTDPTDTVIGFPEITLLSCEEVGDEPVS